MSLPTRLESLLPMASTFYLKWTTSSFFRTVLSQRYVKFPSGCINYIKVDSFDKDFLCVPFVWLFFRKAHTLNFWKTQVPLPISYMLTDQRRTVVCIKIQFTNILPKIFYFVNSCTLLTQHSL